jgi:hypothetical protein
MRIGTALILGAVGAILRFAVEPRSHIAGTFVNWDIVGDILMVAGIVGLLAGIVWMAAANRHISSNTTPREG